MQKINWQEDKMCVPILTNHVAYFRKEKNGYVSIMDPLSKTPNYLLLNKTAIDFLECVDGEKTVGQLLEVFLQKYTLVNRRALEIDLSNIIIKLWKKDLITWEGAYPGMKTLSKTVSDKIKLHVAFENEYMIIKNLMENENKEVKHMNPYLKVKSDLQDVLIRKRLFDMTSVHILKSDIVDGEDVASGLMVVSSLPGRMDVLTVDQLIGTKEDVKLLLEETTSLLKAACVCDFVKIRIYVEREENELRALLENSDGFWVLESVLEKEYDNKDYFSYVHFI